MTICYFSGTGNCLSVARYLSEKTGGNLMPIPEVIEAEKITIAADRIGIVFPAYLAPLSGIPLIIERFLHKLASINSKYIFAVCTCGGHEIVNALPALRNLAKLIKALGGKLSACYSLRLPMSNLDYAHIPVPIVKDQQIIIGRSREKLAVILKRILDQKPEKYRVLKAFFNWMMVHLYRMIRQPVLLSLKDYAGVPRDSTLTYRELVPLTDKSITVNENCNGCATCARVCPVKNIKMISGRPAWQHHCEMCFACDEWCPQKAVQHWGRAAGIKYHHPEITRKDMLIGTGKD